MMEDQLSTGRKGNETKNQFIGKWIHEEERAV